MALTVREKVAHLLRRFGLGASEKEVEYYSKDGLASAIDKLFSSEPRIEIQNSAFENRQGLINIRVMQGLWLLRMISTQKPLEEKMTLFWHNHFATSSEKVESAFAMEHHINTLRKNALGKFRTLLDEISKDPAMIYWLDNQENVRGKPNENFAREVMELFTLGIGNYTEQDVQEAARAFTGWCYGNQLPNGFTVPVTRAPRRFESFVFARGRHDPGTKTVLGKEGRLTGEDVLDHLCENPRCAVFLTKKLWEFFVYENPSEETVNKFAKIFRESDLNIETLLRAIMNSDEFYSDKAVRKQFKNPVDFVVASARSLGIGSVAMQRLSDAIANPLETENVANARALTALTPALAVRQSTGSMGMELMRPPDVSGWKGGANWITSATMVVRISWADILFLPGGAGPGQFGAFAAITPRPGLTPALGMQAWPLLRDAPTPAGVVKNLCSIFDASFSEEKQKQLVKVATSAMDGRLTPRTANTVAIAVCKVIFSSPEFQFC